jgi:NAD(P)-dependent dehydrogenase (short-subunit alcohol dehydrogenase family)
LAAEGVKVVLTGRQRPIVETAVAAIQDAGGTAHGVVADMTEAEGVAGIVKDAKTTFGDPDILVVNSPSAPRRSPEHLRGSRTVTPEWYLQQLPVGRWGEPEEMGALAAFLCSERAAFLTGEVIRLDGGDTKSLF